jgi:hypothetical protein
MAVSDIRKRIVIIGGIGLGVLIALFLFLFTGREPQETPGVVVTGPDGTPVEEVQPNVPTPTSLARTTSSANLTNANPEDMYLKQLSRIFVERFGSFSNQNDNRHIDDVLPLATEKMQQYVREQGMTFSATYSGATTNVIASAIEERTADRATVRVDVQRILRTATEETREYKSATVMLLRVSGEWKIDGLFWK